MAGFFYASDHVSRSEWKRYVSELPLEEYPGVLGYGFIRYVPRSKLPQFLINTKSDGASNFELKTQGNYPELFIIEYIEPYNKNILARGLDIGSEINRREAAIESIEKNQTILTKKVNLIQDLKGLPGFLMLSPIFKKNIYGTEKKERWNSLIGWAYAPIQINELLKGISESLGNLADFVVFEEDKNKKSTILYDSGNIFQNHNEDKITEKFYKKYSYTKEFNINHSGRTWSIKVVPLPEFKKGSNSDMPLIVFLTGILISFLVTIVWASLIHTKENAISLAEKMTDKFQKSEMEAKNALSQLSNQKHALDEHAIVAITNVQGEILYANDKFCEISYYSKEELIGQNHRILNSGYHSQEFFKDMYKSLMKGRVWKAEIKNKRKDGSFYWVESTIVPFRNIEGKIYEYISIRTDITELKEIEEKLRIANATKDRFFSIIGHDLKNPINGILGLVELFLLEVKDGVSKEGQTEYLTMIQGATKSALALLENLLLWARSQSKQIEYKPKNISFRAVLNSTLPLLSANLIRKKIQIETELCEDDTIYTDTSLLSTVLRNLLTNAMKFSHPNSMITVRSSIFDKFLKIEIIDSGIGIEQKNLEKLFQLESLYQKTGTENETGTGLGLLICKEFIEKQGGQIQVESTFGKGSNFYFTIPLENESKII